MKLIMALDRHSFAGAPVAIVRKLRADAIHMPTRDADAYMRTVVKRLQAELQAEIAIEGDTIEERCESFLAGIIRSGIVFPVFQQGHIDASAIRVLRRARGLTQEKLAALLQVSFATVNRWEAGEHMPANLDLIREHLFAFFDEPVEALAGVPSPTPSGNTLLDARKRARQCFTPRGRSPGPATYNKHL